MVLEPTIPQLNSPSIASYDWTDIAEGVGYIEFYAGVISDSSGEQEILSRNPFLCWHEGYTTSEIYESGRCSVDKTSSATAESLFSRTFELSEQNKAATIEGNLIVNIPFGMNPDASNDNGEFYVEVGMYIDETLIASGTSRTYTCPKPGIGLSDGMISFFIDIPKTNIKIGEKIKIKTEFFGRQTAGGGPIGFIIIHDPDGNDVPQVNPSGTVIEKGQYNGGKAMTFSIPYKIII